MNRLVLQEHETIRYVTINKYKFTQIIIDID